MTSGFFVVTLFADIGRCLVKQVADFLRGGFIQLGNDDGGNQTAEESRQDLIDIQCPQNTGVLNL